MKLHTVRIGRIDVFRQAVQLLGDPMRLRLEHGYPAEDEVMLADVTSRATVVEVKEVHVRFDSGNGDEGRQKKCGRVSQQAQRTAKAALPTAP